MPELPEVETIVRQLRTAVTGKTIQALRVFRADALGHATPEQMETFLRDCRIQDVMRRGKYLIFTLEPERYLLAHLRMTGKFIFSPPLLRPLPHHRLWLVLKGEELLVFDDLRCLGTLEATWQLCQVPALLRLGIEPLSKKFTLRWLCAALAKSTAPLKHWLMDQSKIAGLGNIYVAEILHRAALSPLRSASALAPHETRRLHRCIGQVLRAAIRSNGTTISDYRRVDQKTGSFQAFLRVYGKQNCPCPRCGTPIARIRQQQRSTFYCPACQQ